MLEPLKELEQNRYEAILAVQDIGYGRIYDCIEFEGIIENRKGKKYEYFKKVVVTFFKTSFSIEITNTKKVI